MREHTLIATATLIGALVVIRAPGTLRSGTPASRHLLGALTALTGGIGAMSPQIETALAEHRSIEHLNQPVARAAIILAVLLGQASLAHAVGNVDRRALRRSGVGGAVAVFFVLVLFSLSPGRPGVRYGDDAHAEPLAGALVLVFIAYVSWVAVQILQTARRNANQQAGPALATLRWIAVGAALGLAYSAIKSAQILALMLDRSMPGGLATLAPVLGAGGALCVAAGSAGLALRQNLEEARRWCEAYVANRRLYGLWSDLLHVAATWQPTPPPQSVLRDALQLRAQHQRLYRRLVDLRDAWMALRPYFDADMVDTTPEMDGSQPNVEHRRSARLLDRALELHARHREPPRPWVPPSPKTARATDELHWWLGVAENWKRPVASASPMTDDVQLAES